MLSFMKKFKESVVKLGENLGTKRYGENFKDLGSEGYKDWWSDIGRAETRKLETQAREDFARKNNMTLEEFNQKDMEFKRKIKDLEGKKDIYSKQTYAKTRQEYAEFTKGFDFNEKKTGLDLYTKKVTADKEQEDTQRQMLQQEQQMFSPEGIKRRRRKDTILGGAAGFQDDFLTSGGSILGR